MATTYDEEVLKRARQAAQLRSSTAPQAMAATKTAAPAKPGIMPSLSTPTAIGGLAAFGQAIGEKENLDRVDSDPNATALDKGAAFGGATARTMGAGAGAMYGGAKGAALGGMAGPIGAGIGGIVGAGLGGYLGSKTADMAIEGGRNAVATQLGIHRETPAQPSTSTQADTPYRNESLTATSARNMPAPVATTPAAPTTTNQGLGIVRMDAPGASPLFTNLPTNDPSNIGLMARRAAPSAQNVGAMDALAGRYEANTTAQAQAMIDAEQAAASRMTPGQAYLQQAQASMPSLKGMTRLQAATAQQQFQDMNRVRGDAARLDQDAARTRQDAGLGMFRAQDEASTNAMRRKSVQAELDTKAQLDAARQEYLAAGDDPAKQKLAARKLAAFGIKDGQKEGGTWDSIVVGGGVNEQGMKVGGTAMLYNKSTGEVRPIGEQQAQAGARPTPTAKNIAALKADPSLAAYFEQQFGADVLKQHLKAAQ